MSALPARFVAAALAYWSESSRAQKVLFVTGSLLFVSMLLHGAALVATGGSLHGPTSFRKAMTFAETGWLLCWAAGWLLPLIGMSRAERAMVVAGVWGFSVIETTVMSLQVWRGRPSHYNVSTLLDGTLFGIGGVMAAIFMVSMLVLLRAALRERRLAPSLLLSIRAGVLFVLVGVATGWLMIYNLGGVWQGVGRAGNLFSSHAAPIAQDAVGGDIVLLHALGVHGLNLVPLVAWLLSYSALAEAQRYTITAAATACIAAIMALCAAGVLRSQPLEALSVVELAVGALLGAVLLAIYALAGWLALQGILRPARAVTA